MTSKHANWELIRTFIIAVLLATIFRSFAYEPFNIPSGSMKSTLLVGDYLFVSKASYGYGRYSFPFGFPPFTGRILSDDRPERGDVVVFRLPRSPSIDYIKRVVGLPGDKIQVQGGVLYINGSAVSKERIDDFVDEEDATHLARIPRFKETLPNGVSYTVLDQNIYGEVDNTAVYTVPEKHYFMMGDNRDNSIDSRYLSQVGYVPEENLVGKAKMIFFSTDGSARFWEVWKWIPSLRPSRFFKAIG